MARVCSWCALPDEGSLDYVASAGTALKPAHEPIVVARKPLAGTVAANALTYGTGAINVDGCRVGTDSTQRTRTPDDFGLVNDDGWQPTPGVNGSATGRWPANVVLDPDAAAMLDEQTGELTSNSGTPFVRNADTDGRATFGEFKGDDAPGFYGDTGGASRFFYCPKADSAERHAGLGGDVSLFSTGDEPAANDHPTVKPIDLMRWLVRLVTPPGGTVLDPFAGSGTTGCAAVLEGFNFIGIERETEYVAICNARLAYWATGQVAA